MQRLTAEWVRKAEADWRAARAMLEAKPAIIDPACFHCQQVVEKFFKALLQERGLPIPHTHDLVHLLGLLVPHDASLARVGRGLDVLTTYAVENRYPGIHATSRKAKAAYRRAERVRT